MFRMTKGTLLLALVWVLVIALTWLFITTKRNNYQSDPLSAMRPVATPVEPHSLSLQNGVTLSTAHLRGKWTFLFFGYTYCPDICPTTLARLTGVANELETVGWNDNEYQVMFVSIDPERDTLDHIDRYLEYFDSRFIGATAEDENLTEFAKQFGATYYRADSTSPDSYLMAHTSSIFLIDPKGRYVATFSPPHDHKHIAAEFQKIIDLI